MRDKQFLDERELDIYKSAYRGFLKTEQELANVYFNTTVNINITLQGKSGMNYRVFEVLASRGFCSPMQWRMWNVTLLFQKNWKFIKI